MTAAEGEAPFAAGSGRVGECLYGYRIRGRGRSGAVLWIAGRDDEPDRVHALTAGNGRRRVPLFATARQIRAYARRHGRTLADVEVDTLELVRVQRWLDDPVHRKVPPGAVLDAWNFFEDLARGVDDADRLPRQGPVHNSAYEKIFGGETAIWTPDERRAVVELLTAGVELWDSCPVTANPR